MKPGSNFFRQPFAARFLAAGIAWLLSPAAPWLPAQETGHLPVSPRILLEALPRSVEQWTLRASRAGSDLGAVWLESFALRRFEPASRPGTNDSPEKVHATLSVLDTAAHPGSEAELFAGFSPGKEAGEGWLYVRADGRPALVPGPKDTVPDEIRVLVAERFLVTVRLQGGRAGELRFWLDQVDFEHLEKIPRGPLVPLPGEFAAVNIDELASEGASELNTTLGTSPVAEEQEPGDPRADPENP